MASTSARHLRLASASTPCKKLAFASASRLQRRASASASGPSPAFASSACLAAASSAHLRSWPRSTRASELMAHARASTTFQLRGPFCPREAFVSFSCCARPQARVPQLQPAGALEVRYRAAAGVGEEAHSRQRHWCLWSKPVNVGAWGLVPHPTVMAHHKITCLVYVSTTLQWRRTWDVSYRTESS